MESLNAAGLQLKRQEDGKARATFCWNGSSSKTHAAPMLVHDTLRDPQTKSSALLTLGCEKRFKDPSPVLLRNPRTLICYQDAHTATT